MIARILLDALAEPVRGFDQRMRTLAERLNELAEFNPKTGEVAIRDAAAINKAAREALGPEEGAAVAKALLRAAADGVLVLESGRGGRTPAAVLPWALLSEERVPPEVLSSALLAELGITSVLTPAETRHVLESRFRNVPKRVALDENLVRLGQRAARSIFDDIVATVVKFFKDGLPIKSPQKPAEKLPADPVDAVLECLKTSQVTVKWWGVQICMSQACAEKLADLLLAGGAPSLALGLKEMLKGAGISAAMKAAGGLLAFALVVIGLYIAVSLKLNNTPRGVCINILWPFTGGIFLWASGR